MALIAFSSPSFGQVNGNIIFSGTVASSCAFSSSSAGVASVSGTGFSSTSDGTITVDNNDPSNYTLSLGSLTLTTAPDGQSISASTSTPTVTGSNAGISLPAALANAGTDVVSVDVSGTLDSTATAGSYVFTQVVTCAP